MQSFVAILHHGFAFGLGGQRVQVIEFFA